VYDRDSYLRLTSLLGFENFMVQMAEVWRLDAQTRPRVIWVEDDIRTFNHGAVRFGCFCPRRRRAFSKRIGWPVTRQQMVEAILRLGRLPCSPEMSK
jgi:hypothetical protein